MQELQVSNWCVISGRSHGRLFHVGTALNGGAAGKIHLVVSKARPPEVTSGVALPLRFGADVTDSGDPAEPCNRLRALFPGFDMPSS